MAEFEQDFLAMLATLRCSWNLSRAVEFVEVSSARHSHDPGFASYIQLGKKVVVERDRIVVEVGQSRARWTDAHRS